MTTPLPNDNIEYAIFAALDEGDMARLLASVFTRHDPPAVALGLQARDFEAFVRLYCQRAAAQGLSVVARRVDTGEMVGALLTVDATSEPPDGIDDMNSDFHPIFDILEQLDIDYRSHRTLAPGEALHLYLLGVDDSATRRGVAQQLVATCLQNGAERGYRLAITEATNKVSQHIFRKLGFADKVHRSYRTHLFQGRAVFASIGEQGGPILMDKQISRE